MLNKFLVTLKSDQDPGSHWFGSLDPDLDTH
jgi:hypothetical protein